MHCPGRTIHPQEKIKSLYQKEGNSAKKVLTEVSFCGRMALPVKKGST
jgi:hypothetical protein